MFKKLVFIFPTEFKMKALGDFFNKKFFVGKVAAILNLQKQADDAA